MAHLIEADKRSPRTRRGRSAPFVRQNSVTPKLKRKRRQTSHQRQDSQDEDAYAVKIKYLGRNLCTDCKKPYPADKISIQRKCDGIRDEYLVVKPGVKRRKGADDSFQVLVEPDEAFWCYPPKEPEHIILIFYIGEVENCRRGYCCPANMKNDLPTFLNGKLGQFEIKGVKNAPPRACSKCDKKQNEAMSGQEKNKHGSEDKNKPGGDEDTGKNNPRNDTNTEQNLKRGKAPNVTQKPTDSKIQKPKIPPGSQRLKPKTTTDKCKDDETASQPSQPAKGGNQQSDNQQNVEGKTTQDSWFIIEHFAV